MDVSVGVVVASAAKKSHRLPLVLVGLLCLLASSSAFGREINKVLFIGNSITAHGVAEHLNWHGYWGMAASSRQKDFVHQTYKRISEYQGFKPEIYISGRDTGMAGKITNALKIIDQLRDVGADLIVVQLGENEKCANGEFIETYSKLINALNDTKSKPIIACVGTWHTVRRNAPIKSVAEETGSIFVDTSLISLDERNSAEDKEGFPAGVKWHPGDSGMNLYGLAIFEALKPVLSQGIEGNPGENIGHKLTGIVPEPKDVYKNGTKHFAIGNSTVLLVDVDRGKLVDRGVALLKDDFKELYNIDLQVKYETLNRGGNAIMLINDASRFKSALAGSIAKVRQVDLRNDEGYVLASGADSVFVEALTPAGTLYGIQTLRQMLALDRSIIPTLISDFPRQKMRAIYVGLPESPEWLVRKMARLKINICIVESGWSGKWNWWYNPTGENLKKAKQFIALCQEYGIEVVPLIQGLGWAYGVVDENPNCAEGIWIEKEEITLSTDEPVAFPHRNLLITAKSPIVIRNQNGKDIYRAGVDYELIRGVTIRPFADSNEPWKIRRLPTGGIRAGQTVLASYNYMDYSRLQTPYCPAEPETYKIVDRVLEGVIREFKPKYIHIGHDEVINKRRDGRSLKSGKSVEELMGGDIQYWCAKAKELDPEIQIMMWDDLLRPEVNGTNILEYVPDDVIICPWEYRSTTDSRARIANILDWFIVKEGRPTLGTASGYFLNNSLDWSDACARLDEFPNNLGFMFSYWGRFPTLWGKLSFSANQMWSWKASGDWAQQVDTCNYFRQIHGLELNLGLDFYKQKEWLANSVNRVLLSGQDGKAFDLKVRQLKAKLAECYSQPFARDDLSVGIFPENTMAQLERFEKLYRSMYLYGVALAEKDPRMQEILELMMSVEPGRRKEFEQCLEQWNQNKKMPSDDQLFGVKIEPLSPIKVSGVVLPVIGVRTLVTNKTETVYDVANQLLLCRARSIEPADCRFEISSDGKAYDPVPAQAIGNDYVWKPTAGRYLKVIGVDPVKLQFYAMKTQTPVICPTEEGGEWRQASFWKNIPRCRLFTTPTGAISSIPASAAMANDTNYLYFNFSMPANKGDNSSVKVIFNKNPKQPAFLEITAEQDGKIEAVVHGFDNKRKHDLAVVNETTASVWTCSFAVPLSWLEMTPADIDKARVNFLIKAPGAKEFDSWLLLPPNAKHWFNQQPFGEIKRVKL
jgi:hypothetical protein